MYYLILYIIAPVTLLICNLFWSDKIFYDFTFIAMKMIGVKT